MTAVTIKVALFREKMFPDGGNPHLRNFPISRIESQQYHLLFKIIVSAYAYSRPWHTSSGSTFMFSEGRVLGGVESSSTDASIA